MTNYFSMILFYMFFVNCTHHQTCIYFVYVVLCAVVKGLVSLFHCLQQKNCFLMYVHTPKTNKCKIVIKSFQSENNPPSPHLCLIVKKKKKKGGGCLILVVVFVLQFQAVIQFDYPPLSHFCTYHLVCFHFM